MIVFSRLVTSLDYVFEMLNVWRSQTGRSRRNLAGEARSLKFDRCRWCRRYLRSYSTYKLCVCSCLLLSLRYASFNHEFHTTIIARCSRRDWKSANGLHKCPFNGTTPASSRGLLATRFYFPRITTSEIVPAQIPHIITFCKTRCTSSCNRLRKDPCNDSAFTSFSGQDSHHRHTFETAATWSRTANVQFYHLKNVKFVLVNHRFRSLSSMGFLRSRLIMILRLTRIFGMYVHSLS